MSGVNKVIIMGRLGATPELKNLPSGDSYTSLSIATSEKWKDKEGKEHEKTEWHRVTAWRKAAETICKYMQKGSMIYIEGKLQTRSWEDNGTKKYATEIVCQNFQFCGGATGATSRPEVPPPDAAPDMNYGFNEDAIPF